MAVLSAITVYRKELSSNSVYNGKEGGGNRGRGHRHLAPVVSHLEGCKAETGSADDGVESPDHAGGSIRKPCVCAWIRTQQQQRALAARRARANVDQRKLRRLVEGRMRSLDLPVNQLQHLRASVDASWSSFSTAWEARRARGSGAGDVARDENGEAQRPNLNGFVMPPCSHASLHSKILGNSGRRLKAESRQRQQNKENEKECFECAALAAAHAAAAAILRNDDGTTGLLDTDDVWFSSHLGALPVDALHKVLSFVPPQDLLTVAQVSAGSRETADSDLVWRQAWAARFGPVWDSDICREAARRWHLHGWDPKLSSVRQVS